MWDYGKSQSFFHIGWQDYTIFSAKFSYVPCVSWWEAGAKLDYNYPTPSLAKAAQEHGFSYELISFSDPGEMKQAFTARQLDGFVQPLLHPEKSDLATALSIGGVKLSEAAKALEMAGHAYCEGSAAERNGHLQYIQEHHNEALELYKRLATEAQERFGIS